jgi:hypothetical protein
MLENGGFLRADDQFVGVTDMIEIGLANRWFQPLTHVSDGGFPRDCAISCQRSIRGKRGEQRFATAQRVAQSVRGAFA